MEGRRRELRKWSLLPKKGLNRQHCHWQLYGAHTLYQASDSQGPTEPRLACMASPPPF